MNTERSLKERLDSFLDFVKDRVAPEPEKQEEEDSESLAVKAELESLKRALAGASEKYLPVLKRRMDGVRQVQLKNIADHATLSYWSGYLEALLVIVSEIEDARP